MDTMQFFIYLLICAGVTYLIRMIPFVQGQAGKSICPFFFILCALCGVGSHDISGYFYIYRICCFRDSRNDCGTDSFVSAERAFAGGCGGMCRSISDGTGPDAFIDKKSEGEDDYIQFMYDRKK